uniref:Myb/SANT-like DNA-binding domain-containing protein n=1 Tax=Oryzias latipes TaxID=8090 RepID=A0A3P9M656_ORYLA
MSEMGFCRSPHQCRLRVKTLKANYVRAKLRPSGNASQPYTFRYFPEMDAVLGRRKDRGPDCVSVDGMAGRCAQRAASIPVDSNPSKTAERLPPYSSERSFGSLGDSETDAEVKVEDGEESAEGSHAGCSRLQRDLRRQVHLQPQSGGVNLNAPFSCGPSQSDSSCLDPVLKHLSECFQQLLSQTRGLLVQLEGQRQEHAHRHQELLAQCLQREEQRQRETADREERREKARMEHEIRVLELLSSLAKQHGCSCGRSNSDVGNPASRRHPEQTHINEH